VTTNRLLDSIRTFNDRHGIGTGAHVREVGRDNGALLRAAMTDNTSPAPAGQPTATRTASRRPVTTGAECRPGQMFIPDGLTYAKVDEMAAKLAPCTYALRKADGAVTFFEVSEYRGAHRIQMLVGAPGSYQRYPMKLKLQFMALTHILADPTAAIKLFADEANCCSRCHSPLTDATSRATGLGPVCRTKV
jgi:hypothetical protein